MSHIRFRANGIAMVHYWVYEYQKNRTPQQFAKLIDQIRSRKITVPLILLPVCTVLHLLKSHYETCIMPARLNANMVLILILS